jgi:hypothetical protein
LRYMKPCFYDICSKIKNAWYEFMIISYP